MKALAVTRPFELEWCLAGLPALQSSEPGQVRKEAATTIEASAGGLARLLNESKNLPGKIMPKYYWHCINRKQRQVPATHDTH
ncbi:hypothetical protein LG202_10120 [Methylobacillus methanolivorans]